MKAFRKERGLPFLFGDTSMKNKVQICMFQIMYVFLQK